MDTSVTTSDGSVAYVSESGHYLDTVDLINLNCTMDADGIVSFSYQKTAIDYEQSLSYEKDPAVTVVLDQIKAENVDKLNQTFYITRSRNRYVGIDPKTTYSCGFGIGLFFI